jgi:hypothetical protein
MFEAKPGLFRIIQETRIRRSLVFKYLLLRAFDCQSAVFNGWITMRADCNWTNCNPLVDDCRLAVENS